MGGGCGEGILKPHHLLWREDSRNGCMKSETLENRYQALNNRRLLLLLYVALCNKQVHLVLLVILSLTNVHVENFGQIHQSRCVVLYT